MPKRLHILFTLSLTLALILSNLNIILYGFSISPEEFKPLYIFTGKAILLDETLTPVKIAFSVKNYIPTAIHIYTRNEILKYVEGTPFFDHVLKALGDAKTVVVYGACNVTSLTILYRSEPTLEFVEGPVIDIIYPVSPCKLTVKLPVLFEVQGYTYVENSNGETIVKIVMNLTIPRSSLLVSGAYLPLVPENYSWLKRMYLNGETVTALSECRIVNETIYQFGREIGFCPFYIVYPKNASEVREVIEKNIALHYSNYSLHFRMIKELVTFAKYGAPIEVKRVPEIVAEAAAPSLTSKLESIMQLLNIYDFKLEFYDLPSTDRRIMLDFAINALLGKIGNITRVKSYGRITSPYNVLTYFKPEVYVIYIDHYPLEINVPLTAKLFNHNKTINLFLATFNIDYIEIDPYKIDIGYYEVPQSTANTNLRNVITIALVISIGILIVIAIRRLRRT